MAKNWAMQFDRAKFAEAKKVFIGIAKAVNHGDGSTAGPIFKAARSLIEDAYRATAIYMRDLARSNAATSGTPRRLHSGAKPAIFAFSDFDAAKDDKRKRSALVGVRTGLSSRAPDPSLYIRWGDGQKRRKGGTVASKGLSVSLGGLFERGTADRRIKPARYFRRAASGSRTFILSKLTQAYYKAAQLLNKA